MDFPWAEPYPELQKMCVLFERTELSNPEKCIYQPLQSFLQDGPQCGLVALAMVMKQTTTDMIKNIFEIAKEKEYTYNGEMFSVNDMGVLAKEFLVDKEIEIYSGDLGSNYIKEMLLNGGQILVPYDTNKDNSPGLHNGHKAHWCAISGIVQTVDGFFVLARHGKAKNVAIWKLEDLAESNKQLFEFSPDRKLHDIDYKLPKGGISGPFGLNSKCVLISNTNTSL